VSLGPLEDRKNREPIMIRLHTVLAAASTCALVAITSALALADEPPPGPPREPPPEAFSACESKVEGDACTVSLRDRELHGVCATERDGKRLFCRPEGPPPPPPSGSE
jgi:hypothetical protein